MRPWFVADVYANRFLTPSISLTVPSIDQLDKVDPPLLPETYLYLLALQSVNLIVEGFSSIVTPAFTQIVPLHTSLEVAKQAAGIDVEDEQVAVVREMVEAGWPAILAALSWFMGRNVDDEVRNLKVFHC